MTKLLRIAPGRKLCKLSQYSGSGSYNYERGPAPVSPLVHICDYCDISTLSVGRVADFIFENLQHITNKRLQAGACQLEKVFLWVDAHLNDKSARGW